MEQLSLACVNLVVIYAYEYFGNIRKTSFAIPERKILQDRQHFSENGGDYLIKQPNSRHISPFENYLPVSVLNVSIPLNKWAHLVRAFRFAICKSVISSCFRMGSKTCSNRPNIYCGAINPSPFLRRSVVKDQTVTLTANHQGGMSTSFVLFSSTH